ncbi:mitogen-activated protein kinase [Encephalitozoon hellem ATCC 50504]|uniref:Dual specificity tyrosine-phosphorylation-regulated kinase 2 n=1 Tax=Encephalitozoon hellem TaxID=27973 RepID=A0A9Q9C8U7_ENCHE|nr:mitogen-activated protein kinase [Encephalitozoon hellem ATCC 50504]AFM97801.1 mitogen-activated protein kinase [Encephalitozoon hellem ATCC 50504]UTX42572.1 putative serine/threonine-protein kinase MPS1-like protein [Encephalitozoon hellem]WEL38027.1 dual specificity tyrosine-phosphorylation-regulated kinase 2 [Encephalitozoon hellem]|eukprot:XP_003886782.1 mitogen-activated protein kinase [Encephalitozoon hellem ATCC 50504]
MEGIFNSKDLYEYLEEQKESGISKTRKISLYYKATSKSVGDDEYSLRIWLDYIWLLMDGTKDMTEARETFKMIKMRFCKFYNYWEAYIRFEIEAGNENLSKVLQHSVDFVRVKEFGEKKRVLEYLECVMSCVLNGQDLSVFSKCLKGSHTTDFQLSSHFESKIEDYRSKILKKEGRESEDISGSGKGFLPRGDGVYPTFGESKENLCNRNKADGNGSTLLSSFDPKPKGYFSTAFGTIPVKFEKEDYSEGITTEINTALGRTSPGESNSSPRSGMMRAREKIAVKGREVEILKQIGKGGSSKVYKVLLGNNIYALKRVELVGDEKMLNSYINEINLLYKFKGAPEIVEIIDHEIGEDYLHILLEYGETDLSKIIRKGGLSMNFIKDVWEQMLLIVKRVHMERIIHCDLKPANFLFVKGRVKLIDFGISKVIRNDTTSILSEEQCGTVNYMSPEAVTQNKSKVARSSDIWSLGCILYEMAHSKPPLHEYPNLIQKIQKLQEYSEFTYSSKNKLAVMVMKECLVRDPKKRPTIDSLLNHRFLTGEICIESLKELVGKVLEISGKDESDSTYIDKITEQLCDAHGWH